MSRTRSQVIFEGWGRFPRLPGLELQAEDLASAAPRANLTRGLGRSYGDASLPAAATDIVNSSLASDRVLSFDTEATPLSYGCATNL